ncbi:S10 family peptidase [Zymomonas mobilis]|uniref:Peptidase S10 serine carboxypeptidase n=1 Tax=Zymomonas mobilis subsp. pomaceae (strain ATCC 29192 / DSM 22645 / JCM 10191 / CCUG 17912 / NBRC 13757 / NCIMB 11200 / NRRL B-4491 / Barker I) TaxID=579138 RepID=F8ET55_ZYMMT|nr:peptidase S10 [Zymomonas mobilis]AEI36945.1 peptidase S10 serine carboxypeptidase [Zymomonas mobilis subsp. pomaceae ATCC 29192]MDX5948318.1 peptidase S10 [Zymomonas mobilis subsp. pomaceae]GEB89073.1 peptidase S10 [Zymomonas mobilis subsp. pomaceae]
MRLSRSILLSLTALSAFITTTSVQADNTAAKEKEKAPATPTVAEDKLVPTRSFSDGTVTVKGQSINYQAVAGTLIVHPKGWDETVEDKEKNQPRASMFYTAYFKKDAPSANRPIVFLYNGGPGSASVWLHMGSFGPKRIVTEDHEHNNGAPYHLINNDYSLMDVADVVFVDAPATGFSRIAGKDKEKAFLGVDQDAFAFSEFIKSFLTQYNRWNSPKYLFGESYGTPRSAILVNMLQEDAVDFNGVILLSQILNFGLDSDLPNLNPGLDQAYITNLPTYAATAWYHNRLPGQKPANLEGFLKEVEYFATTEYAMALQQGNALDPARKQAIAQKYSQYTGIPVDYILKSDLRLNGGQFNQNLQGSDITTGRLDTRFSGPTLDPLEKEATYDPQSSALSSAYVSAFNDYSLRQLHFGEGRAYKSYVPIHKWDYQHRLPNGPIVPWAVNVLPDLASAMTTNPKLKIMVAGGYFDLATPYYEGWYEMHHLPIRDSLKQNIEYHYYKSGHMVYVNKESLKVLHDDVASFIRRNYQ